MKSFVGVLLPAPFDDIFTYSTEEKLVVGDIVKVEFGKRRLFGLVFKLITEDETVKLQNESDFKIKSIIAKNGMVGFSKQIVKFIADLAEYNCALKGMVLKSFIGFLNSDKVSQKTIEKSKFEQIFDYKKLQIKDLATDQAALAESILQKINDSELGYFTSLIDGVTGSGKTEVYFKIIAEMLNNNKDQQILIMLPEIALSSQLLSRFEAAFGFAPILWHSKISTAQKRDAYYAIANGKAKVVIGARSALLLPYKNLQLIVVDEEHDDSFKQDDVFNFHARDMAILRASSAQFPVILSSATPSLESFSNAQNGKYDNYCLKNKFSNKNNKIDFIDLRRSKPERGNVLTDRLKDEIAKNFANKKQTLLFLNRRGYSPATICNKCGEKNSCLNCSSNLVYHKKKNQLIYVITMRIFPRIVLNAALKTLLLLSELVLRSFLRKLSNLFRSSTLL